MATQPSASGRGRRYDLTEKGRELKAITDAMGWWGARWLELQAHDMDAAYVLWATCRLVELDKLPSDGLVIRIELADRPKDHFWMLLRRPQPEICSTYPGQIEDLLVQTDSATLARWHLRHISYRTRAAIPVCGTNLALLSARFTRAWNCWPSSSPTWRPVKSSFSLCPPSDGHLSTRETSVERNVDKLVDITPSGRRHRLLAFAPDA